MIGCLRTRVRNQPIIALYFESENVLKLYNLEARFLYHGNTMDELFIRIQPSLNDRSIIPWKHNVLFSTYYLTGHLVKANDIGLFPPYGEVKEMFALSLIGLFEGRCLCADL